MAATGPSLHQQGISLIGAENANNTKGATLTMNGSDCVASVFCSTLVQISKSISLRVRLPTSLSHCLSDCISLCPFS